eukprot:GEMP01017577.1.p1 GENE.GEMP01017577.1~~GEMP01017577.1.p1  ORF type:complete len:728 (+),score=156.48 GEMP01017577.1:223-2406(+)
MIAPSRMVCVAAQRTSLSWQAALTLLTHADTAMSPKDLSGLYHSAILACADADQWERAVHVLDLNRARRDENGRPVILPRANSYKMAIRASRKHSAWPTALRLFNDMKTDKVRRDASLFTSVIACVGKIPGKWPVAIKLLSAMERERVVADVLAYNSVITACANSGMWERAIQLLRHMAHKDTDAARSNIKPDVISYSACITACEKGGADWATAVNLLDEMQHQRVPPNIITYNAAISACGTKKGHDNNAAIIGWRKAFDIFHQLQAQHRGITPNVVTYSALMSACEKASMWQCALELLQLMQTTHNVTPQLIAYNACISACEKGRQWEHAVRLLDTMRGVSPNVISYNAAISACEKSAQWHLALRLLNRMRSSDSSSGGSTTNITPNVVTFSACISACEKAGQWQHALTLFEDMGNCGIGANTIAYNACIRALGRVGMWQRALDVLAIMHNDPMVDVDAISFISCRSLAQENVHALLEVAWKKTSGNTRRRDEAEKNTRFDVIVVARRLATRWARGSAPSFIKGPKEAIQLLQILGPAAPDVFTQKVYDWVFTRTVEALRDGDVNSLSQFALPNLGPFTRQALDALRISGFDATEAKKKVAAAGAGARAKSEDFKKSFVRSKDVVAHIKVGNEGHVVRYSLSPGSTGLHGEPHNHAHVDLPAVRLGHDRAAHAERQALMQFVGATGEVQLYVTHRPCISCIAAMVSFQKQSPLATLKVTFDELDGE